jgi:sporulation protein YlmC with PRC-barrel domain
MLQLSGSLLGKDVLSLRSGTPIAKVTDAIINPKNLKIEGFYVDDRYEKGRQLVLLYQDIRDLISKGFIVNDHESLTPPEELVRMKQLLELDFELIGKSVYTISGEKVGKVSDYAAEVETMFIQKIHVSRSILKSLSTHSLSVDRSQIHEITNTKVVIQELLQGTPAGAGAVA